MKKFFSYLIVIIITYAVAAYINNPELRKKINNLFQKRTQEEAVIKNMYVKNKLIYVKKEPQDNAEILGTLKKGTEVGLITTQEKWAKVKTPAGVSGWVNLSSLSEQPVQVSKKETIKKEEIQQEQPYQDLSYSENEKIPSSVVSIFDSQVQTTEEVPDIIKQELQSRQAAKTTTQQKTKTETKTEQQKISQETPTSVSSSTITQQQEIKEKPKKTKKETTTSTQEQEEFIICPNCGAEVIKGERFCPICREPIK